MRFATYGRKSVYSDKSDSVDNQQKMCRDFVNFKFSDCIDSFECYSDEGFTGANTNRPGLQRLLSDISNDLIDVLVVYQLDRISRDVRDFANIYAILEEKKVMFISIKENIDTTTPIGKAMMYVTMVFAQMERETIAARVTDNMIGLAKKGFWTGGNPPYGYRRERIEVNGKTHVIIVPVPEAAEYVEWIFDTFLQNNYSLNGMETAFKQQGKRTINGAFFSTSQLHKILTMPYCVTATPEVWDFYSSLGCQMADKRDSWDGKYGVMIYGRSTERNKKHQVQEKEKWIVAEGIHKPFISAEKWLMAQKQLKENIFERKKKYDIPLLKGVLRCGKCGRLMQVSRKKYASKVSSYYFCIKRARQGVDFCDMNMINCEILDNKVLDIFKQIKADPSIVLKYAGADKPKNNENILKDLEQRADALQKKIEQLTETLFDLKESSAAKYIIAKIEKEDLNLEALKREIELAKSDIRQNKNAVKTVEERAAEIVRLMSGLEGFSAAEKNQIIKEVVQKCTWDGKTLFLKL